MALKKNDKITLTVTGLTSEGSGVGHVDGQAVFVAGAAAGDVLDCVIIKAKPNYAIGKITAVRTPSADRIKPDCRVFPQCGGCVFRHISYEAELKHKEQRVKDAFARIGHLQTPVLPITGAERCEHYRNKAQYPVATENGRLRTGFYAAFSHRVVNCRGCLLQPAEFERILDAVARWAEKYKITAYDERSHTGLLRHIYLRKAFATGEIMVCLVINGDRIFKTAELIGALTKADGHIKTVLLNRNEKQTNVILGEELTVLYGPGYIEDVLCGKRFRISPLSFYQVNHDQAERLYRRAADYALGDGAKTVLDLYCGAGTIGLTLADRVEKLIGVEIVPQAIEDAGVNAALNGITNAEFICADAAEAASLLRERGETPDCVILDPPRKGCDAVLLHTVAAMAPRRIVYVSCDPATLARDCAVLQTLGYEAKAAAPFDLFPRTKHVETVVQLSKGNISSQNVRVEFSLEDMDMSRFQQGATYEQIQEWVQEKYGFHVTHLNIAQVKRKHGIIERKNYNKAKSSDSRQPGCPEEKVKAIEEALKYFQMI